MRYLLFSVLVIFSIGVFAVPGAFADVTVTNAPGSSTPGCEDTNNCFIPSTVTVSVGEIVTWVNTDNAAHTATAGSATDGPSGVFDSSLIMAGGSYSYTADTVGTFAYMCMVHPWMEGTVIVEAAEATNPLTVSTDKTSYDYGDIIVTSGLVEGFDENDPMKSMDVTILVTRPNGYIATIIQVAPNSSGNFSTSYDAAGMIDDPGTYIVEAKWGAQSNETTFEFGGSDGVPPPVEPEPEPEQSSPIVQNAPGSSTPGCEPNCFIPSTVTIDVGGTVTWENSDTAAHTVTSGSPTDGGNGVWDSSLIMAGGSFSYTADTAGTYPYFCMVHPWMTGVVNVGDVSAAEAAQAEAAAAAAAQEAAEAAAAAAAAEAAQAEAAAAEAEAAAAEAAAAAAAAAAGGSGISLHVECSGSTCAISGNTDRTDQDVMMATTASNGNISQTQQIDTILANNIGQYSTTLSVSSLSDGTYTIAVNQGSSSKYNLSVSIDVSGGSSTSSASVSNIVATDEEEAEPEPEVTPTEDESAIQAYFDNNAVQVVDQLPTTIELVYGHANYVKALNWLQYLKPLILNFDDPSTSLPILYEQLNDRWWIVYQIKGDTPRYNSDGSETNEYRLADYNRQILNVDGTVQDLLEYVNQGMSVQTAVGIKNEQMEQQIEYYLSNQQAQTDSELGCGTGTHPEGGVCVINQSGVVYNAPGSSTPGCEPDCFIPNPITVDAGSTITWVNGDTAAHTVTAGSAADGPSGVFDSSLIMAGGSYNHTFYSVGTFDYFCMVHPWMEGTVIVEGTSEPAPETTEVVETEAEVVTESDEITTGSEIQIQTDITNQQDGSQIFAYIVQIKYEDGTPISISTITGSLAQGQTLTQSISWTPDEPGTYVAEIFIWDDLNSANPLSTVEVQYFTVT
jgi:plastocyanin